MFEIEYTKTFLKQYSRLSPVIKSKSKKAISKFQKDSKNPSLKSHKLHGVLSDKYSFSIDHQYRIVFEIDKKKKCFVFLKIGTHKIYH